MGGLEFRRDVTVRIAILVCTVLIAKAQVRSPQGPGSKKTRRNECLLEIRAFANLSRGLFSERTPRHCSLPQVELTMTSMISGGSRFA